MGTKQLQKLPKLPFAFRPDLRSTTPLYAQQAQRLAQVSRSGHGQAHEALPSERPLSEGLKLSRVTARKAIGRLLGQGLVVRRRGSGNDVAPQPEQPLPRLASFSEALRQRGFEPGSQWLSRRCTTAAPDEPLSLGLSPGACAARLERLRLADGTAIAHESGVPPGHALLFVTRVGCLDSGVPVELTLCYRHSDCHGFASEMRRGG